MRVVEPVEVRTRRVGVADAPIRGQFNTGRKYTAEGQRITWAVVRDGSGQDWVLFRDLDRQIEGAIPLLFGNLELLGAGWVLRAYDDHHYTSYFGAWQMPVLAWQE